MELHHDGVAFVALLDHAEAETIGTASDVLAAAIPPLAPVLATLSTLVYSMDLIGGNNGVEISGSEGGTYFTVLPRANGILGTIVGAGLSVASFVANYLTAPGLLINVIIPGIGHLFGSATGEVHCDETEAKSEETFALITRSDGRVGFLSFNGLWTCDHDDNLIYANRQQMLADEGFRLVTLPDGRIQLQGDNGMWVCADRDRSNKRVSCDRVNPQEWETWTLVQMGGGKVALKESEGNFASVAP